MGPYSSVYKIYGTGKPIAIANEFGKGDTLPNMVRSIKPRKLPKILLGRLNWPIIDPIIKPSSYSQQNVYTTRGFNEFLC